MASQREWFPYLQRIIANHSNVSKTLCELEMWEEKDSCPTVSKGPSRQQVYIRTFQCLIREKEEKKIFSWFPSFVSSKGTNLVSEINIKTILTMLIRQERACLEARWKQKNKYDPSHVYPHYYLLAREIILLDSLSPRLLSRTTVPHVYMLLQRIISRYYKLGHIGLVVPGSESCYHSAPSPIQNRAENIQLFRITHYSLSGREARPCSG